MAHELEDCQEILLINEGYYKAGFQVNNVEHLKFTFGPSTRIGTYNILYQIRHEFIIKAVTWIYCYAIRREVLQDLLIQNPQFKAPMKRKEISVYARNLYFPLMRKKRELIEKFSLRKDYD